MKTRTVTLRHCRRVHIVVLVVRKRGGGFYAHLLATHPTLPTLPGHDWGSG